MFKSNPRFRESKFIDKTLVNSFLARIEKQISVEALIVFGSRARGDASFASDYDIAVVSDDFQKIPKLKRAFFLLDNWDADFALEPIAYTTEEFIKAKGLLIWDILEDGIIFKDNGVFQERKILHEKQKKSGQLKKVEEGWKFAVA